MVKKQLCQAVLLFLLFSFMICQRECTVTATVAFWDCINYCWDTYDGKRDFYEFSTGKCVEKLVCGQGYYLDYKNNICIDQFGGYILREIGFIVKTKVQNTVFAILKVQNGYTAGNSLFCQDGWRSSMTTFQKSQISWIIYLCDVKIKDGQIYPKTHGEYFFQKLTLEKQIQVMDLVLGADELKYFYSPRIIIFCILTFLYAMLNLLAFFAGIGKKLKLSRILPCFKEKFSDKKLNQVQREQVYFFLQRRRAEKQQKRGQIKYFSFKDELNKQKQLIKALRKQSEQYLKQKMNKRLRTKMKEKQTDKKVCIEK